MKEKVKASVYFQGETISELMSLIGDESKSREPPQTASLSQTEDMFGWSTWLPCIPPHQWSSRKTEANHEKEGTLHTEVSDWSLMTNLWLFGSINSSPRRRKGSGVTVTTREKSRRRREKTRPWRSADVTGSSLTSVHWRPLPFCCWYCMVGPGLRYRSRKAWQDDRMT